MKIFRYWPIEFWGLALLLSYFPGILGFVLGLCTGMIWQDWGHVSDPTHWAFCTAVAFYSISIIYFMWREVVLEKEDEHKDDGGSNV